MKTPSLSPRGLLFAMVALASVLGPRVASAQRAQDNVVILLDASGSMDEPMFGTGMKKMEAAKQALRTVLHQVPAETHVGLLVFSGQNVSNEWVHPLGPRDDARLTLALNKIQPQGGTPLGAFIKKAADRLLEQRAAQFGYGTFRLLIVTDGEAQDGAQVDRYTPEVIARGITVDAIGVAMKQDHTLARKVHSYRTANDPAALQRAVAEVLAEVSQSRDDATGAEVFELLAAIPDEVAAAAIQSLSTSGNHPIGTQASEARAARSDAPATAASAPPAVPVTSPASGSGRRNNPTWILILIGIVIFTIVQKVRRGGRR